MAVKTLSITELQTMLDAAKAAESSSKAAAITPYVTELLARTPCSTSKNGKPWVGSNEQISGVVIDGVEYRVSVLVTDVAATKALKG